MDTVATTLVTGLPGAGKSALLRSWLAAKPARERWAVLVNRADGGGFRVSLPGGRAQAGAARGMPDGVDVGATAADGAGAATDGLGADVVETVGGCACCSGRPAFEAALVRLLRRGPWDRLLIELDGGGDPARFVDLLRAGAAGRHLRLDEVVAVVDARLAQAWLADADPDGRARVEADVRSGAGSGGPRGRLLAAQLAAADRVVLTACDRLADPRDCQALAAALRARPPFRRRLELARDDAPPPAPGASVADSLEDWPPCAGPEAPPTEWALAHVPGGGRRGMAAPARDGQAWLAWRWPAETGFDRARLERLLADWGALQGLLHAEGAFRTARDWYLWRHDGTEDGWQPTGWRRDNRLEMRLAADPDGLERLAAGIEAGLLGAIREG